MSESLRTASPLSPSPGRISARSRPHFPWTTYTHHSPRPSFHSLSSSASVPSVSYSQTATETRSLAIVTGPHTQLGVSLNASPARSSQFTLSAMTGSPSATADETMRHWSFTAFEWVIHDVHRLKAFVEGEMVSESKADADAPVVLAQTDDFEILKESPIIGDGKFKLEIAKTPSLEESGHATLKESLQTLTLYITSLMLDYSHTDFAISSSVMVAIKCQDDRVGERGARAAWVWEHWQNDWIFRQESEFWECPLPPLSTLLENPRVSATDSFVLCVQIHCPVGPFFPQQPSAYYVPRDLLDGLEASLDNANTGDVRFVCLQRLRSKQQASPTLSPPNTARSKSRSSTSSSGSHFPMRMTARKRILYAHADILMRRSEYFATMLASAFAENPSSLSSNERKIYTIVVDEADFETMYWLLKWVYANWLLFREHEDPREAVDGAGAGWNAQWLSAHGGEWDWKTFPKLNPSDSRSATNETASAASSENGALSTEETTRQTFETSPTPTLARPTPNAKPPTKGPTPSGAARQSTAPASRRAVSSSTPSTSGTAMRSTQPQPASVSRAKQPPPMSISTSQANFNSSTRYPVSPRAPRPHGLSSAPPLPDPHPHPTPTPEPASALSMYQIAHRYSMPGLASLALEHIMSTILAETSFPLLLATSLWEELHSLIEDYVVDKWDEVSVSAEFEQCCQEIAAGEWGAEGGKTLMTLFRRLRSPNAASGYTTS